jgi:hypothetical protein
MGIFHSKKKPDQRIRFTRFTLRVPTDMTLSQESLFTLSSYGRVHVDTNESETKYTLLNLSRKEASTLYNLFNSSDNNNEGKLHVNGFEVECCEMDF